MADTLIRIRTELESAKTVKDLESLRRDVASLRKEEIIGSQAYVNAARIEVDIKNRLYTANRQAYSDNAKMKESYFALGTELRGFRASVLGLASSMGMERGGLGAILSGLASPGGILAGATIAFVGFFTAVREEAKKAADEGVNTFLSSIGGLDPAYLQKVLSQAKAKRESVTKGAMYEAWSGKADRFKRGFSVEEASRLSKEELEKYNLQSDILDNIIAKVEKQIEQQRILAEVTSLAGGLGVVGLKKAEKEAGSPGEMYGPPRYDPWKGIKFGGTTKRGMGGEGSNYFKNLRPNTGAEGVISSQYKKQEDDQLSTFAQGARRVGQTLQYSLSNAFVAAFQLGNGLLANMAGDLLSMLGQGLVGGLFNLIGGGGFGSGFLSVLGIKEHARGGIISEPMLGIGLRSGQRHLMGEAGPERIIPMRGASGSVDPMVRELRLLRSAMMGGNWVDLNHATAYSARRNSLAIV